MILGATKAEVDFIEMGSGTHGPLLDNGSGNQTVVIRHL
jgi:hypothetical protein